MSEEKTQVSNVKQQLKDFGTKDWGTGPTVVLPEQDKRLCDSCRDGNIEEVRQALKDGADPGVKFRLALGEVTPIFLCAGKGRQEIAKVLIENGADIKLRMDFDQTTVLHHAASNNQPEMCAFLIEQKCEVNVVDKLGRTPLMDAAEIGSKETCKVLIENNADINAKDKEEQTALSYCIDFVSKKEPKFYETAKYLVECGADILVAGKFAHRLIIHCAAANGDLEFVKMLVETKKSPLQARDDEGKTPLDYAKANTHTEVTEYIEEYIAQHTSTCNCIIL